MKPKSLFCMAAATLFGAYILQTPTQASLLLSATGSGSLIIVPLSETILEETITISFPTASPFPLDTGVFQTSIDTTIANITDALFNSRFQITSLTGNALFGTYGLTSSMFQTDLDEAFAGVFTVTRGEGSYAGATGGGTFSGTNVYDNSSRLSAITELSATGSLMLVPEPSTITLLGFGLVVIVLWRWRGRWSHAAIMSVCTSEYQSSVMRLWGCLQRLWCK